MLTALDKHTALGLIDLQAGIIGHPLAHDVAGIVRNAARLAEASRREKLPVVLVTVSPIGAPWTLVRAQENAAPQDAASQQHVHQLLTDNGFFTLDPALDAPPDDILLTKTSWSAFHGTDLDERLRQHHVTGIVLGGVATSMGVEGPARAASERGYNITFAEDAMTDMAPDAHAHSLKNIFPRIGEIAATEAIIAQLASRS